ncbi:MAG: cardiolipin synthase [Oscillospiraceae bacterium]
MNKRWFRALFRRRVLIILLLLIQAAFLTYLISTGSQLSKFIDAMLKIVSFLAALYIVSKKDKGAYKTAWIFLILTFPLFGGLLYLLIHFQAPARRANRHIKSVREETSPLFFLPKDGYTQAETQTGDLFPQVRYLQKSAGYPIYSDTSTQFYPSGEAMFEALIPELEKAEKYIFLEFFIVQEGVMWNCILDILKRKAKQGVTVRLIYDDMGCFLLLPSDYPKKLEQFGIECVKFNPFRPFLSAIQNNRDHRKIISVDGNVAFTGGVNLADEYINVIEKHGHWKDSAVMVRGKAAWSFTLIFLQMWEVCRNVKEDLSSYYPSQGSSCRVPCDGFVQPYADSPMDNENVCEHVYLQIINQARDYVYINTPYLIVDDSMVSALTLAAKRGVDVRIITPHKWDKWAVHMTTRSYYRELIRSGVKIYEYTPGFNHSKTFEADGRVASVGTANLDFRSLYLHFECGILMFDSSAVAQVHEDFLKTLMVCRTITEADCNTNVFMRLLQDVLRLFAPLM